MNKPTLNIDALLKQGKPTWKIWYKSWNERSKQWDIGVYCKEYKRKGMAERVAKKRYNGIEGYDWMVGTTNPWVKKCRFCGKEYVITNKFYSNFIHISFNGGDYRKDDSMHITDVCPSCAEHVMDYLNSITSPLYKEGF